MGQVEERGPFLKEFAIVYGELGDLDRAFEYLERAYQEDPGSLTYMNVDPSADALKADPRFDELLRKLGLQ
jgi:tetratricopeptide (TPR) repeat protein